MSKIIIGIHGLSNKPPKKILQRWWKRSIREGLNAFGYSQFFFNFKMVHWAKILHPTPLNPKIKSESHPLYVPYPYQPGTDFRRKTPNKFKRRFLDYLEKQIDRIFLNDDMTLNFSSVSDLVVRRYFKDLDAYYSSKVVSYKEKNILIRNLIRRELESILRKHRRKKIMLIAHSMGSIIAYDVLMRLDPKIKIDTFVTIGSPLGFPMVMYKIMYELRQTLDCADVLCTPENVTGNWYNFSDLNDRIAMNYSLRDDFAANSSNVRPIDKIVYNNYMYKGERNPHKSYGYLRTPEMADVIDSFLIQGENRLNLRVERFISKIAFHFLKMRFGS